MILLYFSFIADEDDDYDERFNNFYGFQSKIISNKTQIVWHKFMILYRILKKSYSKNKTMANLLKSN